MCEAQSNRELVAQAAGGDPAALAHLLVLYKDRLVAELERRIPADLRGILSGEDVCQEAYMAAFRRISSFHSKDEEGFYSWLRTMAARKLVDVIRKHRAAKRGGGRKVNADAKTSSIIDLLDLVAVHERTPSQSIASRELVRGVQDALQELKEHHRQALQLRYVEGLSVAETAERMGRTKRSVEMLCQRGLRRLEEAIGDRSRFLSQKG